MQGKKAHHVAKMKTVPPPAAGNQKHQGAGLGHRGKAMWMLEYPHPGRQQW